MTFLLGEDERASHSLRFLIRALLRTATVGFRPVLFAREDRFGVAYRFGFLAEVFFFFYYAERYLLRPRLRGFFGKPLLAFSGVLEFLSSEDCSRSLKISRDLEQAAR